MDPKDANNVPAELKEKIREEMEEKGNLLIAAHQAKSLVYQQVSWNDTRVGYNSLWYRLITLPIIMTVSSPLTKIGRCAGLPVITSEKASTIWKLMFRNTTEQQSRLLRTWSLSSTTFIKSSWMPGVTNYWYQMESTLAHRDHLYWERPCPTLSLPTWHERLTRI